MNRSLVSTTETSWYDPEDADFEVEFSDLKDGQYNRMSVRYPFYWFEVTRVQ